MCVCLVADDLIAKLRTVLQGMSMEAARLFPTAIAHPHTNQTTLRHSASGASLTPHHCPPSATITDPETLGGDWEGVLRASQPQLPPDLTTPVWLSGTSTIRGTRPTSAETTRRPSTPGGIPVCTHQSILRRPSTSGVASPAMSGDGVASKAVLRSLHSSASGLLIGE